MISNFKFQISKSAKKIFVWGLAVTMVFCLPAPSAFANVLGNPDFSLTIGNGTASNWDSTNGAVRVDSTTIPAAFGAPPDFTALAAGQFALQVPSGGSFTFQTFNNIKPGDYAVFSVNAETDMTGVGGQYGDLKIEFRKKQTNGSNVLIREVKLSDTLALGIRTARAAPSSGYPLFTVAGTAPEGTDLVVFTIATGGAAGRNLIVTQTNAEVNPAKLVVTASKTHVAPGDAVGINAYFQNTSGASYRNVSLRFNIPHGFDYAKRSVRINGHPAVYQNGSIVVNVGNMAPDEEINVAFVMLVSSGIQIGKAYSLDAILNGSAIEPFLGGTFPGQLAQTVHTRFLVSADPVFEEGTVIGKVFNDLNENTVQDCGEDGIPWVRLYTEEGIGIVTDENGMYHIPGVKPGQHVVKIDGHSLPEGTKFVSEEAYEIKTTPGIMSKANFAVLLPPSGIPENFEKDLTVMVTQGVDISRPTLDVKVVPEVVKLGVGVLEKEPVFTFDNNYGKFIKKWTLEVRDEMGQPVWTGYGIGQPPPEVTWSGITESGLLIRPGMYSYQLKVRDVKAQEDWTALKFFEVMNKRDPKASPNYHPEITPVGDFNVFKDGKQSIPMVAKPVVRVQGKTKPRNKVMINETPVTVDGETGLFQKEFFTEPGEHTVLISATTPEGETTSFTKKITVKDSMFFMVALGEEQLGENWARGAMEDVDSDAYRDGFRQDGRLAFFLKGKLKGKFLVKAKYDTSDKRSALFTSLDPNQYYPIYGDNSTRDYQAQETAQRLFALVEWDRSFAQWGSFKTEFTDTELATYNRTLSGLKVNFDTVKSTVYGDSARGFKLFSAKSENVADHNEFYATGGSLYYTRNRNIVEGSEKIRVEVRDKIQDMAISSYDLQAGTDYEIIYDEGRILLSRPLSMVAATDTLTSTDILDGSPVYLIVDYEYNPGPSNPAITNQGIRGYTWLGDHLRIGATGIQETRPADSDYDMVGVDAMMKFGRNTKITGEYARTINQQMSTSVSYDGGLAFADLGPLSGRHDKPQENAYLIKASSEPFRHFEASGYVQGVEPTFSNPYLQDQIGLQKYGISGRYKLTDSLAARYRFDHSEVLSQLMPLEATGTSAPYHSQDIQTAQVVYDDGQYLAELEYQRRNQEEVQDSANLIPELTNQIPFKNGLTGKLGYHINERLLPYVKVQTAIGGWHDNQFGGGVRYEIMNNLFAYLEEMMGPLGDSTYFGFERQHGNGARSYANIRSFDRGIGDKTLSTAIGNSFALTEKSRMYSEREYSSYRGQDGYADILGYEGKAGDRWDYGGKFERRHLDASAVRLLNQTVNQGLAEANTFNVIETHLAYADGQKLRARTALEVRVDQTFPNIEQFVTKNSLSYKWNDDLSFLTYFNYGNSDFGRLYGINREVAGSDFAEFSTGFAYRPLRCDRFNALGRYTYLRNFSPDQQFSSGNWGGVMFSDVSHIVSLDAGYDVNRYFGLVQKLAWKHTSLILQERDTANYTRDEITGAGIDNFLSASRINFHVTRKWDLALEYRLLAQFDAMDSLKQGALVEVDREFYEYVRLGVGYNFTDFSDDLRDVNSSRTHGPFVRMTGKF